MRPILSDDRQTLTVRVPLRTRQRVGRKKVVTPDGVSWAPQPRVDNAMVKALARAFRWRKELDTGAYASLDDLAAAKGIAASYVSRVLRPTLLAPQIVEALLDGRQPAELQLEDLLEGLSLDWREQLYASKPSLRGELWREAHGAAESHVFRFRRQSGRGGSPRPRARGRAF